MRNGAGHMGVRARGVGVVLGGRRVLDRVDLEAEPGEVLALLGPNGAGKSTLLKALAGRVSYQGQIELGDTDLDSIPPHERARRVAYVPQRSLLRSALSVEEVVAVGRYAHGPSFGGLSKNDRDAIAHALETAHADTLRDRVFTQLSVGEQQRVLLARALASDAPVLLLDEPTAALDVGEGMAVLELIRGLAARRHTVIVVLHDLADARSTTDRAILLKEGRIIECGSTSEVVSPDPVRAVYGVELVENARIGFRPRRDSESDRDA